ncbi:MAG: hypothetical protein ACPG3T_01300, partial [Pseudomonadales bacterium]
MTSNMQTLVVNQRLSDAHASDQEQSANDEVLLDHAQREKRRFRTVSKKGHTVNVYLERANM